MPWIGREADMRPVTKIFAQISLAVFLAALVAPCGIVPRHDMPGTASSAGTMGAGHENGAAHHDSSAAVAGHGSICGVDIAAPRSGPDPVAANRHGPAPAFDVIAAGQSVVLAPPAAHGNPRAGPPEVQLYFPVPRLLM